MKVRTFLLSSIACLSCTSYAADWELDLDARLLTSNGHESFLDGGLGALRFGEDQSGLQLGRVRFGLDQPVGQVVNLHLDTSTWDDDDKNPLDLTEAYLEYRPYPRAGYRARVKAGAFYAPISLENRASGWESPYTLSSSAINTWIGEELRTIGLEGQLEWLGTRSGHSFDIKLTAALFGWNDPVGGMVAGHGFALHDRQTTLFGRVGPRNVPPLYGRELFHEIDGRVGAYAGVEVRYLDRLAVRALRYDNRADPKEFDPQLGDFAWDTRFDSEGLRFESAQGWTAILQWLDGETYIAPGGPWIEWLFDSRFALLSKKIGPHTLSVRYDDFSVDSNLSDREGVQNGHAWTAAYVLEPNSHWRFTFEWLRVRSELGNRPVYLNESPLATESQLQLAVRYAVGSRLH
jgi:hypothetical protein